MCDGAIFIHHDQDYRIFFPNPNAKLPVLRRNGDTVLLPWGRHINQPGQLPMGGWARLESIYAGYWNNFLPTPVKIPIMQFMEKDIEGISRWYELPPRQYIQGLVARKQYERRIYVVTVEADFPDTMHERWPRIIGQTTVH